MASDNAVEAALRAFWPKSVDEDGIFNLGEADAYWRKKMNDALEAAEGK